MEVQKIAFLETFNLEDNAGIMGAIMVTDADTKPLEFRVNQQVFREPFMETYCTNTFWLN